MSGLRTVNESFKEECEAYKNDICALFVKERKALKRWNKSLKKEKGVLKPHKKAYSNKKKRKCKEGLLVNGNHKQAYREHYAAFLAHFSTWAVIADTPSPQANNDLRQVRYCILERIETAKSETSNTKERISALEMSLN